MILCANIKKLLSASIGYSNQGSRSTEHGCMDPKSGVFEAPFTGVYFFALHVCTHDLKKALLSIRKNGGTELASLYDQNHVDNHKVISYSYRIS